MGYLRIHKLVYSGENYNYESPEFSDGINIIEGENGSGKSTFSNLISYSLGNYVKEFDYNKKNNKVHKEIVNDRNNYVLTTIYINEKKYILKRFFNDNKIFIEDNTDIKVLYINRTNNIKYIFSDWILEKLNIPNIEYYQGTSKSKLNFSDLFRLVYYDQKTEPEKIYKNARTSGNFISDSEFIRKVIFQILMGHEFSEYYAKVGELNEKKKEKDILNAKTSGFIELAQEFGYKNFNKINIDDLKIKIQTNKMQIERLNVYEEELLNIKNYPSDNIGSSTRYKKELLDLELELENDRHTLNRIYHEIKNIKIIKKSVMLEVTQLQKIILTHEKFNLFSPESCPYCKNKINRQEGHCICGHEIDESEYEKFFYSSSEYLSILKSKNKSLDTLDLAIKSCEEELAEIEIKVNNKMELKSNFENLILESKRDVVRNTNIAEINDIQKKKYNIKEEIRNLEQYKVVKENYDDLIDKINAINSYISKSNSKIKVLEENADKDLNAQIEKFCEIYSEFLVDIKNDVDKAQISKENYMPIINNGEYREASIDVTVRLMYFITLLKIAIEDENVPYPRFLLIDTPESKGIDLKNLNHALSKFLELESINSTKYQVILTSGKNKYPKEMEKYKKGDGLTKKRKLLKEK